MKSEVHIPRKEWMGGHILFTMEIGFSNKYIKWKGQGTNRHKPQSSSNVYVLLSSAYTRMISERFVIPLNVGFRSSSAIDAHNVMWLNSKCFEYFWPLLRVWKQSPSLQANVGVIPLFKTSMSLKLPGKTLSHTKKQSIFLLLVRLNLWEQLQFPEAISCSTIFT